MFQLLQHSILKLSLIKEPNAPTTEGFEIIDACNLTLVTERLFHNLNP